ncbi:MAG: DUF1131 family protein [Arsenophonus sp. NC-QC1-MAG3]
MIKKRYLFIVLKGGKVKRIEIMDEYIKTIWETQIGTLFS